MCALIVVMLIFCIPLLLCLDIFINQTVMLFGYMNAMEIEKEVNNCRLFLEIFFKDSYTVKLTFKKKNQNKKIITFTADDISLNRPKALSNPGSTLFNLK
jgi:hypothetical protein